MNSTKKIKLTALSLFLGMNADHLAWAVNDYCLPNSTVVGCNGYNYTSTGNSTSSNSPSDNAKSLQDSFSDQQERQIVRQISSIISTRVSSNINPAFSSSTIDTHKGASADGKRNPWIPDTLWSNLAYTRLSSNGTSNGVFNADIYQIITGIDKNAGNFYFGGTVNYAGTTDHFQSVTPTQYGTNNTVGLTPYAAYVLNKNFFISGLTGYNYSSSSYRGGAPSSELDAYVTELDLNGLQVIGNWFMKGKTGARYLHTHNKINSVSNTQSNLDSWTYLIDLEGGYAFENGLRAYSGILFENTNPSSGTVGAVQYNNGKNIFYYSAGADYAVSKKLSLGGKVQTDLNNDYVNLTTISLNARFIFD